MNELLMTGAVAALMAGSFFAGAAVGRKQVIEGWRAATDGLNDAIRSTDQLKVAGYGLIRAIARLRAKENLAAPKAQTAVNNWTQTVLKVEGDKP